MNMILLLFAFIFMIVGGVSIGVGQLHFLVLFVMGSSF
jgi:hypothetical protein